MKTYSLLLICLTLGLFYGLAVNEQNNRNYESAKRLVTSNVLEEDIIDSHSVEYNSMEDEFVNHVTGKDHMFLNTGISYIEEHNEPYKLINVNKCIAENSKEEMVSNPGS